MSVVLAYSIIDNYNIIMTDTRIMERNGKYNDNNNKLYYVPNNIFLAGVGAGKIINGFVSSLNEKPINAEMLDNDCLDKYKKIYQSYVSELHDNDDFLEFVEATSVFVAFADDKSSFIRMYHHDLTRKVDYSFLNGRGFILLPPDYEDEIGFNGIELDITKILTTMLYIFKQVTEKSKLVSDIVSFCITKKGEHLTPFYHIGRINKVLKNLSGKPYDNLPNHFNLENVNVDL